MKINGLLFLILGIFCCPILYGQSEIKLQKIATGLSKPLFVTHVNDDRIFIVEQGGKVKILKNNKIEVIPFLNITDRVNSRSNEQGLLGLAFHPDFKKNGFIYVNYIANGANRTIVSRFNLLAGNSNVIDSLSEKILIIIQQPFTNHNGGCLQFGPDGYLYIGQGDGGSANDPQGNGQNTKTMLAKMLRIDIDTIASYKIPPSNPFVKDTNFLPEIWAYGLRNPWRWSFDRLNGDLWIGDVGQGEWEEIDYQSNASKGGENYGWRCYEGHANFNTAGCDAKSKYKFPIYDYFGDENILGCSVTGGYVYRGSACSYLYGDYIYGDYCSGIVWAIKKINADSFVNRKIYNFSKNQISSFGEDSSGELYLCALGEGAVYKISDTCNININSTLINPTCDGISNGSIELTNLNVNCNLSYKWSNGKSGNSIDSLSAGKYTVIISNQTCEKQQNFNLIYKENDTACITPLFLEKICASDSALIIACDHEIGSKYLWYVNGLFDSSLVGQRIFVRKSGDYQVKYLESNGCESSLSKAVTIIVYPIPNKPIILSFGDSLVTSSGYGSYVWYRDGQLVSGTTVNYLNVKTEGFYQVVVIDSNQCRSLLSDSLFFIPTNLLDVSNPLVKVIPNPSSGIFSFYFENKLIEASQLTIFSANSRLVHQENIEEGSNQKTVDLNSLPAGIYYFKISSKKSSTINLIGKLFKY